MKRINMLNFRSFHLGHETIVQLLLQSGANVDSIDEERQTPLLLSAKNGNM